jgi:hypothetical protein
MKTTIKLNRGDEVVINGYIIRAIGLDAKRPNQLSVRKHNWPMLWCGYCDDVLTTPSVIIGDHSEALPDRVKIHKVYSYQGNNQRTPVSTV